MLFKKYMLIKAIDDIIDLTFNLNTDVHRHYMDARSKNLYYSDEKSRRYNRKVLKLSKKIYKFEETLFQKFFKTGSSMLDNEIPVEYSKEFHTTIQQCYREIDLLTCEFDKLYIRFVK